MISTLKKKFILTAMIAISIAIVVMFGGMNALNIVSIINSDKKFAEQIISGDIKTPDNIKHNNKPKQYEHERFRLWQFRTTEDRKFVSPYFTTEFDKDGNAISCGIFGTLTISDKDAKALAKNHFSIESNGYTNGYFYMYKPNASKGVSSVFIDITDSFYSIMRVIALSSAAAAALWGFLLILTIILAQRTISPIAQSIEKQRRFVTDAGHELKTPLTIINANTEALELYNGESKWSKNIKDQIVRLNELMENLLELSKLDSESFRNKAKNVDMTRLARENILMFEEPANAKYLRIVSEIDPDIIIKSSKEHMNSVMSNLIENAIKYSSEYSEVNIKLFKDDKKVVFQVENQCDELPDCNPENLFDRFFRVDSARTQKNGGCGIGLSSVKAIAEVHGASVTAEYIDPNRILFEFKI